MKTTTALIILALALLTKCNESPKEANQAQYTRDSIEYQMQMGVDTVSGHCETVYDTRWNQPVRRFRVERPD
jgi:sugar phosphate isomerase/epimerase